MIKTRITICLISSALLLASPFRAGATHEDDFTAVVKTIEQFYHVKHQTVPLLARAGVKAVRTAAKIRGGEYKRITEAGSVRVAWFEDQTFDSHGEIANFKESLRKSLSAGWSALVQTLTPREEEQTYIFIRDSGKKFQVLVITIERNEATVVQATMAPEVLANLLKDPSGLSKSITDETSIEP